MPFIDARSLEDGLIQADICIIGAGAAGIAIARELAGSHLQIALIESGGIRFRRLPQTLYLGENIGLRSYATTSSRFRTFGGSTTRWGGQCRPFDPIDFEARPWMRHSGWPFGRDHLEPYYVRASAVCHLQHRDFDPVRWSNEAGRFRSVSEEMLETRFYQFSQLRDFGIAYGEELSRSANVKIYLNANVVEIETDRPGNNVTALRARTFNRKELRFAARAHVLACGGIENARLLLASNRIEARGVGNRYGLVGRFFADHPYFLPGYLEPSDPCLERSPLVIQGFDWIGSEQLAHVGFGLSERKQREEQLNGACIYLIRRPDYKTRPEYFSSGGRSFNALIDIVRGRERREGRTSLHLRNSTAGLADIATTLIRQVAQLVLPHMRLSLRGVIETSPNPDSRVTLGPIKDRFGMPRVRVDWRVSRDDQRGLERLLDTLRLELPRHGIGHLVEDFTRDDAGWPMSMVAGKHHIGTTRMHADPKQGVVDADCRVHGTSNLFIAGSSVFPTSGYANPTLTIVALALRLADRLKSP